MKGWGFGPRWCSWIEALLGYSSTWILLNSIPGPYIFHAKGLRQGDSLSLFLFLLVMDILNCLLNKADEAQVIQPSGHNSIQHRCSLYAEVIALFDASTMFQVGNGESTLCWTDAWFHGSSFRSSVPDLVACVARPRLKTRTVKDALHNRNWVRDISGPLSIAAITQFLDYGRS